MTTELPPTPNMHLQPIRADRKVWTDMMNGNLKLIDAVFGAYFVVQNLQGLWQNSTDYTVDQTVVDEDTSVVYLNSVAHRSASLPTTFAEDRDAHPDYWSVYSSPARARGEWTGPGTAYALNDFVVYGPQYAVCIATHISGATFAADRDAGKWSILVDLLPIAGPILPSLGGTGIANNDAATLTRSGHHSLTITTIGPTSVQFPQSGTLAVLTSNTFTGLQTVPHGTAASPAINLGTVSGLYSTALIPFNISVGGVRSAWMTSTLDTANTAMGYKALLNDSGAGNNTAFGAQALEVQAGSGGHANTAVGSRSGLSNTDGYNNTYLGHRAGEYVTTGNFNCFVGAYVAEGVVGDPLTGHQNTGVGEAALIAMKGNSNANTALGMNSLFNMTTANENTALGAYALFSTTTASSNTSVGWSSLVYATGGTKNVVMGHRAMFGNVSFPVTGGTYNVALGADVLQLTQDTPTGLTAVGGQAGYHNTTGSKLTAVGYQSLYTNLTGTRLTALGYSALNLNLADDNTAVGNQALEFASTGDKNTAVGSFALGQGSMLAGVGINNAALGYRAGLKVTGGNSIFIGADAGRNVTTGAANVLIGTDIANTLVSGDNNIIIGTGVYTDVLAAGSVNTMNIGNLLYATDLSTTTAAGGKLGILNNAPATELDLLGAFTLSQYIAGIEMVAPSAPAANGFRIYAEDNGAGKTRLMAIFGSGAAQQLAIEP